MKESSCSLCEYAYTLLGVAMNLALKMAIHASGKRQKQIAKRAGLKEPRMSLIVNGVIEPSDDEQHRIARALNRTVAELFHIVPAVSR